ncbi:MAG: GNAT family N-acetyltransferase [Variibacter sp.]|nr:GNAT family N-acetyltransferase [Variibacter sp.]
MIDFLKRLFGSRAPTFDEARPQHAAALAALHAASFRRGWSEDEFERLLFDPQVIGHRAAVGRKTVGFILSRRAADEAEILSVAVAARHQGSGVGRALLTLHLRRLAGLAIRAVFLEVDEHNTPALRLYERAGFVPVGRRSGYYARADGSPSTALVLRRDLI